MSTIISIIGAKGGTGKTTLSHMLCYGLGLIGRRAVCVMTDEGREPPPHGTLPYVFADGRSAHARVKIIATLRERTNWIGVIDGGANNFDTDSAIYQAADLVLLPFRDSQEDLRVVCRDLERLPHALALPSQWPSNPWQYKAAQRLIETAPRFLQNRILSPVFSISSSKLLLQTPQPDSLPTPINNASRAFARYVLQVLEDGAACHSAQHSIERLDHLVASRQAHLH
jgi:chromosome partitioning protein